MQKGLQALGAPFVVAIPGLRGQKAPAVEIDFSQVRDVGSIVTSDSQYDRYSVVLWNVAVAGLNCNALHTNMRGDVCPDLIVTTVGENDEGVKSDPTSRYELDLTDWAVLRQSSGQVRVDHLQDENGVPLGIPPESVRRTAKKREWAKGVLNPARLEQLQRELEETGDTIRLKSEWLPTVPNSVAAILTHVDGRTSERQMRENADKMDRAQANLEKAAASITEVVASMPAKKGKK